MNQQAKTARLIHALEYLKGWINGDQAVLVDLEIRINALPEELKLATVHDTAKMLLVQTANQAIQEARTIDVPHRESIDELAVRTMAEGLDVLREAMSIRGHDLGDTAGDRTVLSVSTIKDGKVILVLGQDVTGFSDDELAEMLSEIESDYEAVKTYLVRNEGTQLERDAVLEVTNYKTVDLQLLRDSADEIRRRLHLIE